MQIHVHTDHHTDGRDDVTRHIQAKVKTGLPRLDKHLTRVDVHLRNETQGGSAPAAKRCLLAARPAGASPAIATHHGRTVDEALDGALRKLSGLLGSRPNLREVKSGAASIRDRPQVRVRP